jgi:hypothetical protein
MPLICHHISASPKDHQFAKKNETPMALSRCGIGEASLRDKARVSIGASLKSA